MTEKSHIGIRQRYVSFRFQDSLRRYQPPPRKLIKPNESVCCNCYRKSCESGRESRLVRLCETRKYYNAASRERASQFSKKKQAMQQSLSKASGHVSDFNCQDHIASQGSLNKQVQMQIEQGHNEQVQNLESRARKQLKQINWSIKIKQTPIKESVRQQLMKLGSFDKIAISQEKVEADMNEFKVKDIEFHIGLVEELHQKIIDQYLKLQVSEMEQDNADSCLNIHLQFEAEKQNFNQLINTINLEGENNKVKPNIEQLQQEGKEKQDRILSQLMQQDNKPIQQQTNQMKNENIQRTEQITQNFEAVEEKQAEITGRVEIKGDKGSCYLSLRILTKLIASNLSPNKINKAVLKRHPYLGDVSHLIQSFTPKNN